MVDLRKGDCLELLKSISDKSIDMVLTDPPYLIDYKTGHRKDKNHKFCFCIENDNNFNLISDYVKECFRVLKDNTAFCCFCNSVHIDFFKKEIEKYFKIKKYYCLGEK